jgi:hypothetical protein
MWTVEELHESFRYGQLMMPYKIIKGWYHCYRIRKEKTRLYIDKKERIVIQLPSFGSTDKHAEVGDLIFVHPDKTSSLLRQDPNKPFFKR